MAGSPLDVLTDIAKTTSPAFLSSETAFVNEARKRTYVLPRFMSGKDMSDMVQGGETIRDDIFLDVQSSYEHYHPNAPFTYSNPQLLTQWQVPWRFTKAEAVYTAQELGINQGQMNQTARALRFKKVLNGKMLNLFTDYCNGMEDDFWAQPDYSEMEAAGGKTPQSLACFVHEFNVSGGVAGRPRDKDGATYTTVQNIDPSTETKWGNLVENYTSDAANTTPTDIQETTLSLFRAMTKQYRKLKFSTLPKGQEYSDPGTSPNFMCASNNGLALYEDGLRVNQDTFVFVGRQDPSFMGPTFRGMPIVYIDTLDAAALYDDGSSGLATEAAANNSGPRFYMLNGQYICKVWHSDRYFHREDPIRPSGQPFTRIQLLDCWHNNVCRSRRRHGLIVPSNDVPNYNS